MAAQRRESYRFRIAAFFCGLGIMSSMVERKVRKIKGLIPPEHLRNHTLLFEPGLIPPDVGEALRVAEAQVHQTPTAAPLPCAPRKALLSPFRARVTPSRA